MEITKDQLQKQIDSYMAERDQLLANFNAINGAIKDCDQWIAYLDTPEPQPATAEAATQPDAQKKEGEAV